MAISKAGFARAVRDRPIFMNVNDRFSEEPLRYDEEIRLFHGGSARCLCRCVCRCLSLIRYDEEIRLFHGAMEALFPPQGHTG